MPLAEGLIHIRKVKTKKDLKTFICLPEKIHRHLANWIPPVYMDEKIFFNPKKNNYFSFCDTILLVAYKNEVPSGRIMGIINHRYNNLKNENSGRFACFECINDEEVSKALLQAVETWLKNKGISRIVGPLGFSDKEPQGFLVEGFEHLPVISANYNPPYMPLFLENLSFVKEVDSFSYTMEIPENIPGFYEDIFNRSNNNKNIQLLEFRNRRILKKYIRPVFHLINKTYAEIYASMPLEESEMDDFVNRYLLVIDPAFVKCLAKNGEIIAVVIAMPDLMEGIKKARGRLLPFGFYHILRSQKKTKKLVMLLGGISEEYRGLGYDTYLGVKILKEAYKKGFTHLDSHLVLEQNNRMRREYEKLGGKVYKVHRVFRKEIN